MRCEPARDERRRLIGDWRGGLRREFGEAPADPSACSFFRSPASTQARRCRARPRASIRRCGRSHRIVRRQAPRGGRCAWVEGAAPTRPCMREESIASRPMRTGRRLYRARRPQQRHGLDQPPAKAGGRPSRALIGPGRHPARSAALAGIGMPPGDRLDRQARGPAKRMRRAVSSRRRRSTRARPLRSRANSRRTDRSPPGSTRDARPGSWSRWSGTR